MLVCIAVGFLLIPSGYALTNVTACGTLSTANEYYTLNISINSSATCLTIGADNIIIDGQGYTINYSQSVVGYAVNNSLGYDNITIKNLNILQENSSVSSGHGLYGSGMTNSSIINNNITINNSNGYGIYLVSSSKFNSISGNNVTTHGAGGWGINTESSSDSNNILNNVVKTTTGATAYGITIRANSNNVSGNNVTTSAIGTIGIIVWGTENNTLLNNIVTGTPALDFYQGAANNVVQGGSYTSPVGSDYYMEMNTVTENNISNTNFTAARKIQFSNSVSFFNYNNETNGNIWLKTNVSAASTLTRTLVTWSQPQMRWNDTNSSAGITARYILTGLFASTQYTVTNTSSAGSTSQTLTTDIDGNLPSFTIDLNGNTEIKAVASTPYGIGVCRELNDPNGNYTLVRNVSSAGGCFTISANNITLDGQGYTINYSQSATGDAIYDNGYDYITLKNLNIVQASATYANSHAIHTLGMENSSIINNNITVLGAGGYGLYIRSSSNSNTFSNNIIRTSGTSSLAAGFITSTLNNITGGSIISEKSYDYYLRDLGVSVNFTNTNFTVQRSIYFFDSTSWFNYRNDSSQNIWLKTNISLTGGGSINRTLVTWSNSTMKWNDTNSSAGITVRYNLTGLLPTTTYAIYNTSGGTSTRTLSATDASGVLPSFTVALSGETQIHIQALNLSSCADLDLPETYNLVGNVSSSGTCFTISVDNITLDGQGYWVNYSQSVMGYAVNNTGYNYTTIKNANIVQGNSTQSSAYAIYFQNASNGTLQNNTITTSGSGSFGIWLRSSSNSNNVSNNTILTSGSSAQGIIIQSSGTNVLSNNAIATSGSSGYGVQITTSSNSNILSNNNITTSGSGGYGIRVYLSSNSNTLSNNNITTLNTSAYGIYIWSASSNNITGGSIISNQSYDYYLNTADTTNNFTNTNFTAKRQIYFADTSSWFNYNNDTGNIWLKNKLSGAGSINRTLATWSNSTMKWNETPSAALTATYNITGLLASTTYAIYNTTGGTRTRTLSATDSEGILPSFNIALSSNTQIQVQALNLSACGDLDLPETYNLVANVNSSGTCFAIKANNVTLDGAGYTINYSQSAVGYAIDNQLGYNFTTIKNANIVQGGTSWSSYAIYFSSASNGTIQNNTVITASDMDGHGIYLVSSNTTIISNNLITTLGQAGYGIYIFLSSNLNNISDNTITTLGTSAIGVWLNLNSDSNILSNNNIATSGANSDGFDIASSSNTIIGGSIISQQGYDYYLQSTGTTNNFTNTNFTASRKINFQVTSSWFNYRNDSSNELWLKTNASKAGSISRTLTTWSNTTMRWNDTNGTSALTMRYNLTGLLPTTTYAIYNTTGGTSTRTVSATDANGVLPSFTVALGGNTQIQVQALNLSSCADLDLPETYTLTANVNSASDCFNIKSDNVTLDGQGYTVNYSQSTTGYAINNSLGYDNITLKNLNIIKGSTSTTNAYAIFANGMTGSNITNNTISLTTGSGSIGIYINLSSNSNTISYNKITTTAINAPALLIDYSSNSNVIDNNNFTTTNAVSAPPVGIRFSSNSNIFINNTLLDSAIAGSSGFYIQSSDFNSISGGSIFSQNRFSYYLINSTSTNNFTNTNFTASRNIYFNDAVSEFKYSNDSVILLKTNISAQNTIGRTIVNWNNTLMKWNDTNQTANLIANYTITGLVPNAKYAISNASGGVQTNLSTLTTDSVGNLPSFTIALNGNTEIQADSLYLNVTSCQDLDKQGAYYYLTQNVSSTGTCFTVKANNVTLDGKGYLINYSQSAAGYAINNTQGYDNIIIANLTIMQGNASNSNAYAIVGFGMSSSTIFNNTITTSGGSSVGIYMSSLSDSNTVSNNNITTSGASGVAIYVNSSAANIVANNTVVTSNNYGVAIYLAQATSSSILNNNITTSGNSDAYGIYISAYSNLNNITNNTITTSNIAGYGIYLLNSSFETITGNTMNTTNAYAFAINPSQNISEYNHTIDTTNTEQSGPIYYYFANTSVIVQDLYDAGQVLVANSTNFTLRNITIVNKDGIYLLNSINSSILDSNISTGTQTGVNGIGLYLSNLSTISNNTVSTSGAASGVYLYASGSNALSNNSITATANSANAIFLDTSSNSNTLLNNNITNTGGIITSPSAAISIRSANGNNITGGWTLTKASDYSYDFKLDNAGITNNFVDVNFTGSRKIRFLDSTSYFNYNNQTNGNIWLKTNVSAGAIITRTLATWSQFTMKWNDSTGITAARYNLTGLFPGTQYTITNTSSSGTTSQTLATNINGNLPSFTVNLNGNTEINAVAMAPYGVSSCQDLTIENASYVLVQNVSSSGTCFTIKADNVTLDGTGYWINYSQSQTGYGINNSIGYANITIKNLNIIQGNASVSGSEGIYVSGTSYIINNTIRTVGSTSPGITVYLPDSNNLTNNNITTSGTTSPGIQITTSNTNNLLNNNVTTTNTNSHGITIYASSSNNLINNTVIARGSGGWGIYVYQTSNSNISGGSIISNSYDYTFRYAGATNNFVDTNFTTARKIYFYFDADPRSYFNYNNGSGNIWLKTNVSATTASLTRTLVAWSQSTMKWNDTNGTAALIANYNLTGLLPNTTYVIYNTSGGTSTRTLSATDASGILPSFTVALSGETQIHIQALNLSSCADLDLPETYNLVGNVSSSGTCFTVKANNVTLDGQGYWMNYSQVGDGYGINNSGGYDNITITNLNVVQDNSSAAGATNYAIYASGMIDSIIRNNTISTADGNGNGIHIESSNTNNISDNAVTTSGTWSYPLYLQSSGTNNIFSNNLTRTGVTGCVVYLYSSSNSNNLSENIIKSTGNTCGVAIKSSSNNSISGGSIISNTGSYNNLISAGATNNFTNTNFTGTRRLYWYNVGSWFNYNNDTGNIWLKTNVSKQTDMDRTLVTWSQSEMKWNDSNLTASLTSYYTLTGLSPSRVYNIYNTSSGTQTNPYILTTDSDGALSFSISLKGNTEILVQEDTTAPTITINSPTNRTYNVSSIWFNVTLNEAGSWAGYSLDGAANVTMTNSSGNWNNLSTVADGQHYVTFYANDTNGNMNVSAPTVYFTVDTINPTVSILSPTNTTTASNAPLLNALSSDANPNSTWYFIDSGSNKTSNCNSTTCLVNLTKDWIIGSGGDSWAGNTTMENATKDMSGESAVLGVIYDSFNDLNYNGWIAFQTTPSFDSSNMLCFGKEVYYPLNFTDVVAQADVKQLNDGGLILSVANESGMIRFYLADEHPYIHEIARYNRTGSTSDWATLNSSFSGCPAGNVCREEFRKVGNLLTARRLSPDSMTAYYNISGNAIKYDNGSVGVHFYASGSGCFDNFRAFYPNTSTGSVISKAGDAEQESGSGAVWTQISFMGDVLENTSVNIYVNTSADGSSYSGYQLVKANASANTFYNIPDSNKQRYASWKLVLDASSNSSFTPTIQSVSLGASLIDGSHAVNFFANDSAGNMNSTAVYFTVDTTQPFINFTGPTDANNSFVNRNWAYANTTISDASNTTAFIDFNRSLVGWWRFNREAGENDTFVRDWSSYGNNGTIKNMNRGIDNCTGSCSGWTASGKFGYGTNFDGANDYVTGSDATFPSGAAPSTMVIWFKPARNCTDWVDVLLGYGTTTNSGARGLTCKTNTEIRFWGWGNDYDVTVPPIGTTWHQVIGIYNGTHTIVYFDGIFRGATARVWNTIPSGEYRMGWLISGLSYYFNGTIDEVQLYSRALSEEEINASFNAGSYRLYHNFTNLTDATYNYTAYAQDLAGNVNQTETRILTVDTTSPAINFTSPTPANNSFINVNLTQVNITITEPNLNTFKLNWNGSNYSFYDPSLILAMNFNNNSAIGESGNVTADIGGYGNNGICYNFTGSACNYTTSGKFGKGVQFDGSDDYIGIPASDSINAIGNKITIEAWIRTNNNTKRQTIVDRWFYNKTANPNVNDRSFNFILDNATGTDKIQFMVSETGTGGNCTLQGAITINSDEWTHVAVSYNGSFAVAYVNGQADPNTCNSTNPISWIHPSDKPVTIGVWHAIEAPLNDSWSEFFNGAIDEVRVYNRSLSAAEIAMHYQSEFQKYNSTTWQFYNNITNLTDGTYTYYGYANDSAGNHNTTEMRVLTIDTVPPAITVQSPTNDTYATNSIWFNITGSEVLNWSGYSLDGAANVSLENSSGNWNFQNASVTAGTHSVTFYANDTAGNMNSTTVGFTITTVNACQDLSSANMVYTLVGNVSSSGTCFTVKANNATLDGNGYWVNYSTGATAGYGVNITSRNNITIINLNIINGNTSLNSVHAIYLYSVSSSKVEYNNISISGSSNARGIYGVYSVSNSNISNNLVTSTGGSGGAGIQLRGSNNLVLQNNVRVTGTNTHSIWLDNSQSTSVINGSYIAINGDDVFLNAAGTTNNFTNINFTASRKIEFSDNTSWFNYNNDTSGNIWLKTNITVPTGQPYLLRALSTWSQPQMQWNDTNSTAGITARYNLTGLLPSATYAVYNTSSGTQTNSYTLNTDSGGTLQSFTIDLNGNTEIKLYALTPVNITTDASSYGMNSLVQMNGTIDRAKAGLSPIDGTVDVYIQSYNGTRFEAELNDSGSWITTNLTLTSVSTQQVQARWNTENFHNGTYTVYIEFNYTENGENRSAINSTQFIISPVFNATMWYDYPTIIQYNWTDTFANITVNINNTGNTELCDVADECEIYVKATAVNDSSRFKVFTSTSPGHPAGWTAVNGSINISNAQNFTAAKKNFVFYIDDPATWLQGNYTINTTFHYDNSNTLSNASINFTILPTFGNLTLASGAGSYVQNLNFSSNENLVFNSEWSKAGSNNDTALTGWVDIREYGLMDNMVQLSRNFTAYSSGSTSNDITWNAGQTPAGKYEAHYWVSDRGSSTPIQYLYGAEATYRTEYTIIFYISPTNDSRIISLAVDKASNYSMNENVVISGNISRWGNINFTGNLDINITGPAGIFDLSSCDGPVDINSSINASFSCTWNASNYLAGTYNVSAAVRWGISNITLNWTLFNITETQSVNVSIDSNKNVYGMDENISTNINVTDLGNANVTGNLTLTLTGSEGKTIYSENSIQISPTVQANRSIIWNLTNTLWGNNYVLNATYYYINSSNNSVLIAASATKLINIIANRNATALISTDSAAYSMNADVNFNFNITTAGNAEYSALNYTITINNSVGTINSSSWTSVARNTTKQASTVWNTGVYPTGDYNATLTVTDQSSGTIWTASAVFSIGSVKIASITGLSMDKMLPEYYNLLDDAWITGGRVNTLGNTNFTGNLTIQFIKQSTGLVYNTTTCTGFMTSSNINTCLPKVSIDSPPWTIGRVVLNVSFAYNNGTDQIAVNQTIFRVGTTSVSIWTTDSSGNSKSTFSKTETVYVHARVQNTSGDNVTGITVGNVTSLVLSGDNIASEISGWADVPGRPGEYSFNIGTRPLSTYTLAATIHDPFEEASGTSNTILFEVSEHRVVTIIEAAGISPVAGTTQKYVAANTINSTVAALVYRGSTFNGISSAADYMSLDQMLDGNSQYIVFTKGSWETIKNRMADVISGAFERYINPSFGFPLLDVYRITISLEYSERGINTTGDVKLSPGIYTFVVKNEGTQNGETLVSIKRKA